MEIDRDILEGQGCSTKSIYSTISFIPHNTLKSRIQKHHLRHSLLKYTPSTPFLIPPTTKTSQIPRYPQKPLSKKEDPPAPNNPLPPPLPHARPPTLEANNSNNGTALAWAAKPEAGTCISICYSDNTCKDICIKPLECTTLTTTSNQSKPLHPT